MNYKQFLHVVFTGIVPPICSLYITYYNGIGKIVFTLIGHVDIGSWTLVDMLLNLANSVYLTYVWYYPPPRTQQQHQN